MPNQSGRCSRARFTGSRGMPRMTQNVISSAIGTLCQKIQRQDRFSVYQPSSVAAMFRDSSRFSA